MFGNKIMLAVAALAVTASGISACSSSASSTPQSNSGTSAGPAVTVSVAVANISNQNYIPLVLAQKLGFFSQEGINLKITNVTNGSQTFTEMLAGQVDGVVGFYDHNIDLNAKGTPTESVIQLLQDPGMVEVVRADEASSLTSPSMLSGKSIGITGLGGSTQFIADYLAQHNGVSVSSLHPVSVAAGPTFVAAMQHNEIDAGITTEPTISALLSKKLAKVIVDMRSVTGTQAALGGPYPGTAVTFKTSWVNGNSATVQRFVTALVKSLQWIQTHSAKQIADEMPASYYGSSGETSYVQALANQMGMFSPTGLMPSDGPQSVYRVLSAFDPAVMGHQVDLTKTYTDQFVQHAS